MAGRRVALLVVVVGTVLSAGWGAGLTAQEPATSGRVNPWPCRLIVMGTLRDVIEKGWQRSTTLQRQCRDLTNAGAVVVLEWARRTDSMRRAVTTMKVARGVVVAQVSVPPASDALQLVAHELEHVIERAEGLDYAAESKRPGSGVWETRGIFETQRAIDAERQVAQELLDRSRVQREATRRR